MAKKSLYSLSLSEVETEHNNSLEALASTGESVYDKNNCGDYPPVITKDDCDLFPNETALLNSIIGFGKWKGYKIEQLIENHTNYMDWLISNDVIALSQEVANAMSNKRKIVSKGGSNG